MWTRLGWRKRFGTGNDTTASRFAFVKHIVESKARANRPKDRLFLETHAEALEKLIGDD